MMRAVFAPTNFGLFIGPSRKRAGYGSISTPAKEK